MKTVVRFVSIPLLASFTLFISCSETKVERSTMAMGTVLTVTLAGMDQDAADRTINAVFEEIDRIENLLSTWKPESDLSRLNREAASGWYVTDEETFELLNKSVEYARLSDGAFDITAGPIIRLWGFHTRSDQRVPSPDEIAETMTVVGYSLLELDEDKKAVRFSREGMELDVSGVAKGYAVDKAVITLRGMDIRNALINLGGNVFAMGSPPGRERWRIAVRDPRSDKDDVGRLLVTDQGVASSGQYVRYIEIKSRRYGHIIDPRTGKPVEGVRGTTIIAPDAVTADILSTATFVMGREKAEELIKDQEVEGLVIQDRGDGGLTIRVSEGLRDYFEVNEAAEDVSIEFF